MTTPDRIGAPGGAQVPERESEPDRSGGARAARPEVRNPMLRLASVRKLLDLPQESQDALRGVFLDIRADSRDLAEKCWAKHKAPMAAYWKAVSVYAGHLSRCLRRPSESEAITPAETAARPKSPAI